ncbi:MAG: hypothetical protein NBV67_02350 [Tagaea sp.]|nr:hypothetical protein [Tagaea sp.]
MTGQTPFRICSQALIQIGANAIASFDDGTTESTVAGQVYEPTVAALLSLPRWTFAKRWKSPLERKPGTPAGRGSAQYHLPADMLAMGGLFDSARNPVDFTIGEGTIVTLSEGDWTAEYTYRAPESVWPPLFAQAVVSELAGIFALAVARNQSLGDAWTKRHLNVDLPRARTVDAQSQTTRRLRSGRLVWARG